MKIIAPYQISSEILNLINQSKEYLILVSPYVNFQNWEGIKTEIRNAQKRGVKINFYTRLDNDNYKSWTEIEALDIHPKLVKNLHAKLYFSEQYGIVTSMNLLTSSNLNAIEFGSIFDTREELEELKEFIKRFLEPNVVKEKPKDEDLYLAKEKVTIILTNYLSHHLHENVYCKWNNTSYQLNAKNTFFFNIDKGKNTFWISGIISGWEYENTKIFLENTVLKGVVNFEIGHGAIVAILNKQLSNTHLDNLLIEEKKIILDTITSFVFDILTFKDYCYKNRKKQY